MTRVTPLGTLARIVRLLAVVTLFLSIPSAAHADGAGLQLDQSSDLSPKGQKIAVTGSGFQPNTGLYLVTCDPAVPKGGACDMANFSQVKTDADGAFSAELKVVAAFGQTDCLKTPCAVQTSKIGDGADRSQEATAAVSFKGGVAAASPTPEPETTAPAGDDSEATGDSGDSTADKSDEGGFPVVPVAIGVVVVLAAGGFVLSRRRAA